MVQLSAATLICPVALCMENDAKHRFHQQQSSRSAFPSPLFAVIVCGHDRIAHGVSHVRVLRNFPGVRLPSIERGRIVVFVSPHLHARGIPISRRQPSHHPHRHGRSPSTAGTCLHHPETAVSASTLLALPVGSCQWLSFVSVGLLTLGTDHSYQWSPERLRQDRSRYPSVRCPPQAAAS